MKWEEWGLKITRTGNRIYLPGNNKQPEKGSRDLLPAEGFWVKFRQGHLKSPDNQKRLFSSYNSITFQIEVLPKTFDFLTYIFAKQQQGANLPVAIATQGQQCRMEV